MNDESGETSVLQLAGDPSARREFSEGNNGMSYVRRRDVLRGDIPERWSLPSSRWDQEASGQEISSHASLTARETSRSLRILFHRRGGSHSRADTGLPKSRNQMDESRDHMNEQFKICVNFYNMFQCISYYVTFYSAISHSPNSLEQTHQLRMSRGFKCAASIL